MSRYWLVFILLSAFGLMMLGCAGTSGNVTDQPSDSDTPLPGKPFCRLLVGSWLEDFHHSEEFDHPGFNQMMADACSDTSRSWLWINLKFSDESVVRILGTGALLITYRDEIGMHKVVDRGIHVTLEPDAKSPYLNSEGGPFTIRSQHLDAATGAPGVLLVGLPRMATQHAVVLNVETVPRRWQFLP